MRLRPVPGRPRYKVDDEGGLWSWRPRTREWQPVHPTPRHDGYMRVTLYGEGGRRQEYLHRLILLAFVGKPDPGQETRHLDGNPANNRLDNLAWGTKQENAADRVRHRTSRAGPDSPLARLTARQVRDIRRRATGGTPQAQLARRYRVGRSTISRLVQRLTYRDIR